MNANTGQEKIGIRRFPSGIEFQKQLLDITRAVQNRLLTDLPSNYSKNKNTNLAEYFRALSKEFGRLSVSGTDISEDQYHSETRVQYLFQILGDTLFLGEKAINENIDDQTYREFLIRVRDAYYGGSRKDNIESAVSDILDIPVTLKELYLKAREEGSFYGLKDTHRMLFDIFMDDIEPSSTLGQLLENLRFFVDIIKPSHVQYDTRLIWTDQIGTTSGDCTPVYDMADGPYVTRSTTYAYLVTYVLSSLYKYDGVDPSETWTDGVISAIDEDKQIIRTTDNRILIYTSSTTFYERSGSTDTVITVDDLTVGDDIRYYATKDSATTSDIIDTDWAYSGVVTAIDETEQTIDMSDVSIIVYNDDLLVYTRDGDGEYRIEVSDLYVGAELVYKATEYDQQQFQFYNTPEQVQDNYFKQFDETVIERPYFQENVKKELDTPEGLVEGPQVVIKDGIATVIDVHTRFYKREDTDSYREREIHRYSLYLDDTYTDQFSVNDPARPLTAAESKSVFMGMGYTGLAAPNVNYEIQLAKTGKLVVDGDDAVVQGVGTDTEMCDRRASCQLMPFYEDVRKYCTWPDLQLTSGFFDVYHDFGEIVDAPGEQNLPAWYHLSSDQNTYQVPLLPMLGSDGEPAGIDDLTVYVNGLLVADAVTSVDPWSGIVSLNFIPPFNSRVRIDYYYASRYPKPQYYLEEIRTGVSTLSPADLGGQMVIISSGGSARRLTWPYPLVDTSLYGDDRDYQVDKFPMLNQRGELATTDEVEVSVGMPVVAGTTEIDSYQGTSTVLSSMGADWSGVQDGDALIIQVENYMDNTLIYIVSSVDNINGTLTVPNLIPQLQPTFPYRIIRFTSVADAVMDIRPLLGHVRLNFLPPAGAFVRFNYYYTSYRRNYLMVPDTATVSDPFWSYGGTQYAADTYYGSYDRYTLLSDTGDRDNPDVPFWPWTQLRKVGYRYSALTLANSSVLNSETLVLNDFEKEGPRGSMGSRGSILNDFDVMYSPEFLTDTDKNVILNDKYLLKDIPAVTQLNPGVPPFIVSQTDDGHHKLSYPAVETDTYDPDLEEGLDIPGAFTIIDPDDSGIIDFNNVCEFDKNKQINMYSDLTVVEQDNGGYDASLSSICDAEETLPFKTTMIEQYYPNRELRLTDYLDYINQIPTEYKSGSIKVIRGSAVIKSRTTNFYGLRVGDTITVKDVPFTDELGATVYKDLDYVLLEVVDVQTGKFNKPFEGISGEYDFDLVRDTVFAVDVALNEVNRALVLNGQIGYTYGIPDNVLQHFPGYGDTGTSYTINFPDPDPDPYPRNPDNPWIANPTGIMTYPITGMVIDGNATVTNRTLGYTGWVLTSQIIDADGNSYGYTGYATGITGPSGALDLGITGPTGDVNPRIYTDDDIYQVPAGSTGIYSSYSEAEYRVQWRNWDQDLMIVTFSVGDTGVIVEEPFNLLDDIGEGIIRYYWDVNTVSIVEMLFHGTLMETTEMVSASVAAASYTDGLILLTQDQVDGLNAGDPPATYDLTDTNYQLNKRIVRELLEDNSVKITEIQEFIPL